jgi:hypothetical protein
LTSSTSSSSTATAASDGAPASDSRILDELQALAIAEKAYGPDHPKVAIRINSLGRVLRELGDRGEALEERERGRSIGVWETRFIRRTLRGNNGKESKEYFPGNNVRAVVATGQSPSPVVS